MERAACARQCWLRVGSHKEIQSALERSKRWLIGESIGDCKMSKGVHFAASLIAAGLAGTSIASGQSLTNEECREMGKAILALPPIMGVFENEFPKFESALNDKLLPRTSDQLRAATFSAIQASKELLPALRKFNAGIEALSNQLQLCADANSTAVRSSDANAPPTIPAPSKDAKSGTTSVSQSPGAPAPVAKVETPTPARETPGKTPNEPSPYLKVSFVDLALDQKKLQPDQKIEMTGNLETELSGSMVFLYNHGLGTRSTAARLFRQVVVTKLSPPWRAYILEHCGGIDGCPATVRGTWSQNRVIIAQSIQF